jgi:GcrA cell cycle regulator
MTFLVGHRHNHTNTPWTDELTALLMRLWSEGFSASQIADQIKGPHLSRNAIIGKANRLRLPARAPPKRSIRPGRKPRIKIFEPKPKPQPPAVPSVPTMRQLTLLELEPLQCRWPIGVGKSLFCGADAEKGEVYCLFHRRLARRE